MINGRKALLCTLTALIMVSMTAFPVITLPETIESISNIETVDNLTSGYADDIHFQVIDGIEQQIQALQNGQIDLIGQFVDPDLVPPLIADPSILISQTNRKGFGLLSFNCEIAPTNWTALRQAFSYSLDKDAIQQQALSGYSRPVDSPVPPSLGAWSLDNHPDFSTNYYERDPVIGNTILDAAGFVDLDTDGWREDPNYTFFEIGITYSNTGSAGIETIVDIIDDAFDSIGIRSYEDLVDYNTLLSRVDSGDFNVVLLDFDMIGKNPFFLEHFQSDDVNNDWNFFNSTYDDLINIMLESSNETEVYEACWAAQRILWEEQPLSVLYQNLLFSAYRADPWESYVNTEGAGLFDDWTFLKVHLKNGLGSGPDFDLYKQGGRFTVSLPGMLESTNLLNSDSVYTHMPLDLVYDSLYRYDPYSLEDCAWLASDWLIEEVNPENLAATPGAEEGDQIKITLSLNPEMIYWHDGVELTSEDVAYSYNLVNESNSPIYSEAIEDVTHIETPDSKTVEIFCSTGSFFTLNKIRIPIFPKHIWETIYNPLSWTNPVPLGSGPYKWKSHTPGSLVVLERNDDFIYNPRNLGETLTTTTVSTSVSTTTTVTTSNTPPHVKVLFPFGGEEISGEITAIWSGGDNDGDPVYYDVYISPNGGYTWIQLDSGTAQKFHDWDTSFHIDGDNYLIKVVASDGIDSSTDVSDNVFSLVNYFVDTIAETTETSTVITETSAETTSTEIISTDSSNPFSSRGFEIVSIVLSLPIVAVYLIRKRRV